MIQKNDIIDSMRVASPCTMNWDAMKGDKITRFCDLCGLHVHNISEMTGNEVKTLLATTEGQICAKLYRRTDGTVITKDCPVGLSAIRRRVYKKVGATVTAIIGLCLTVTGKPIMQASDFVSRSFSFTPARSGALPQLNRGEISGRLLDQNGAEIPSASISILNQNTGKKITTSSKDDGTFLITLLPPGLYTIEVSGKYFETYQRSNLHLGGSDLLDLDIVLSIPGAMMGIIVIDEPDMTYRGPATKTVFSEKQIRNLPY